MDAAQCQKHGLNKSAVATVRVTCHVGTFKLVSIYRDLSQINIAGGAFVTIFIMKLRLDLL